MTPTPNEKNEDFRPRENQPKSFIIHVLLTYHFRVSENFTAKQLQSLPAEGGGPLAVEGVAKVLSMCSR